MKVSKIFLILCVLISHPCISDDYRNMVSFGPHGLGWSGAAEKIKSDSNSNFDGIDYFLHNIGLNFAYRLTERFQLGVFYQTSYNQYKFKSDQGKSYIKNETSSAGVFGIFNFTEQLSEALFLGLSVSNFRIEEENSKDVLVAESKNPFELDDAGYTFELLFGKRFQLKKWNIEHLSFSPQLGVYQRTHGKDFADQRSREGIGISLQPIKFDFLF